MLEEPEKITLMRIILNMHCVNLLKRQDLRGKNIGRQGCAKNQAVQDKQYMFVLTVDQDVTLIKDVSPITLQQLTEKERDQHSKINI